MQTYLQLFKMKDTVHQSVGYMRDLITHILEKGGTLKSNTTTEFVTVFSWCLSWFKSAQCSSADLDGVTLIYTICIGLLYKYASYISKEK